TAAVVVDTPPTGVSVGDTIEYTIELQNKGLWPLGNTAVIDAPPPTINYVPNSTTWNGNPIPDSPTGTPFPLDAPGFNIPIILRDGKSTFTFRAVTTAPGIISNSVTAGGYALSAQSVLYSPPSGTSTQCNLSFSDAGGTATAAYSVGAGIYVNLADADANTATNSIQSISVVVSNITRGDVETITLFETGVNTGIFRNSSPLASSATSG